MREQLIQYVNLLFAAAPEAEDIRDEILQNTLDRYDDLIAQGKQPEAAYRLAISGIGDINEILGTAQGTGFSDRESLSDTTSGASAEQARKYRAIAIAMYILCPIPLFLLSEFGLDTLGLCLTLGLVAAATYVLMLVRKNEAENPASAGAEEKAALPPKRQGTVSLIRTISIVLFLLLSFLTGAWYITWLIFPIAGCVRGLVFAIMDLKEAN